MMLPAKRLLNALQDIPLLEKCQPIEFDEQTDERSNGFFNNLLFLQMTTKLPLDYVQYILILSGRCCPMHYTFSFYIREDSEILRFEHFTSGI